MNHAGASAFPALLAAVWLSGCQPVPGPSAPSPSPSASVPVVRIHFLGGAAFILRFDNGLTVLSDYGGASPAGGPVQEFGYGTLLPDVVTISQIHHPQYYRPVDFPGSVVLVGDAAFSLFGLEIAAVPAHELSMEVVDNYGYLFVYKGMRVLYAGEPLQYILAVGEGSMRREIRERYPDSYDLVILPLSGPDITFPQLESFICLLDARRIILMHGESSATYTAFLDFLDTERPGRYHVEALDAADYGLYPRKEYSVALILSLTPAPYEEPPAG